MQVKSSLKKIWYGSYLQPVRNQFCVLLKFMGYKPNSVSMQRLGFDGVFNVKVIGGQSLRMQGSGFALENKIFWYGLFKHESFTIQTFLEHLKIADWFVDVGSNSGIFSLVACSIRPSIKVIAIEPMPIFYSLLQQNISLNGFSIAPLQLALSNQNGSTPIFYPKPLEGNIYSASLSLSHFEYHQNTVPNIMNVQTKRFDDLVKDFPISGNGIIKIDAEGHGVEVLEGMQDTIQRFSPVFMIEVMSATEANKISNLLNGYSFFGIRDDSNQLTGKLPIPFSGSCNNYLCIG